MKKWKRILLLVSHSQDFLNGVCTNIINIHQKKLQYYTGTLRFRRVEDWGRECVSILGTTTISACGGDANFCLSGGRRINRAPWFMKLPLLERLASDLRLISLILCVWWCLAVFVFRWLNVDSVRLIVGNAPRSLLACHALSAFQATTTRTCGPVPRMRRIR